MDNTDNHKQKKQAVLEKKSKGFPFPVILTAVIIILAAGAVFYHTSGLRQGLETDARPIVPENGFFVFEAAMHSDHKARHYVYRADTGQSIRFFILKSPDGVLRSAFDACDFCWESNMGYVQDGDFMICLNCGMRFHADLINVETGGCNPAPLNSRLTEGKLVISEEDVLEGAGFFDFSS